MNIKRISVLLALLISVLLIACSCGSNNGGDNKETDTATNTEETAAKQPEGTTDTSASQGEANDINQRAKELNEAHKSKAAISKSLKSEGFTDEEIQSAIDGLGADWNENALACAKDYVSRKPDVSRENLKTFLASNAMGFTEEEAQYAIDHLDD